MRVAPRVVVLVMSVAFGVAPHAAAQFSGHPAIHTVTVQPDTGVPTAAAAVRTQAIGAAPLTIIEDFYAPWRTALGVGSLVSNTINGHYNTAIGYSALYHTTTGRYNTATGAYALGQNTVGSNNTAVGFAAGDTVTGQDNTAVGFRAGVLAEAGSYNVFLGSQVQGDAADTNTIRIGLPYDSGTGAGQNQTFIAGVYGTPLSGTAYAVFIDENGQLGTLTPPIVLKGTGTISASQPQQLETMVVQLQQQVLDQNATNAELRARLAKLEALLASAARRK